MNRSLYKLIIFIGMLGLISSCSDDDSEKEMEYEVVENLVSGWDAINSFDSYELPIIEILCIGESKECLLADTYVSIENYGSDHPIVIPKGLGYETEKGYWLAQPVPSNELVKKVLKSDHYGTFRVLFGGEGTYDFAVKIYSPSSNKYFITRPHRLKVWKNEGEEKWNIAISLIEG